MSTHSSPLNIAIFTDTYHPQVNGVVTSTDTFVNEFRKQGHSVYIFAPGGALVPENETNVFRFPAVVYPFHKEYVFALPFLKPIKNFAKFKFDIVHIQTPFSMGLMGLKLAKKYNIPIVHTYHTFFERYLHYVPVLPASWLVGTARMLSQRFCNQFDAVFAPSVQMKRLLAAYNIHAPIHVVPTGIAMESISEADKMRFRQQHNIRASDECVIFGGRLGKEKNVYFMLDAFIGLSREFPQLRLLIVGDGPERQGMEAVIEAHGIQDKVQFTGYVTRHDMLVAFSIAKLYLFPSKTETQGLTLLECLSVGTPAVGIRAMGVKHVMPNNHGGVATRDDLAEYIAAASLLLRNPQLYGKKCGEAIQQAKQFSSESIARQVIAIYRDIISSKAEANKTE